MSPEPSEPSTPSSEDSSRSHGAGRQRSVVIPRVLGILCVAGGFMLGIQGLAHPNSPMLPTALGLLVAGLVAQVFALVRSCYAKSQGQR
ncbi:MAG: hypothetical protein V3U07_02560 [Nitrospirales bacterium]